MNGQRQAQNMRATRASSMRQRLLGFGMYMVGVMVLYFTALEEVARLSSRSGLHSHIPLIPLVSLFLFGVERRQIFARVGYGVVTGLPVIVAGLAVPWAQVFRGGSPATGDALTLAVFSVWLMVVGGFLLFFGPQASREAVFPLAFLAFAIPLPEFLVKQVVAFLLWGSGAFTELFFKILGVTFLRVGSIFQLGHVTIEIAPECSGIRSSLALLITMTIAARMFLRRWWARGLLLLAVVPLVMVKNAIRIVTLTLLAEHVDMRFLTGHWLHRSGGFVFFGIVLVLFGGILLLLRRFERGAAAGSDRGPGGE